MASLRKSALFRAIIISLLGVASSVGAYAADKCIPKALEKIAPPSRMDVWRYHGEPDFDSANHLELRLDDHTGGYYAGGMGTAQKSGYVPKGYGLRLQVEIMPALPGLDVGRSELESGSKGLSFLGRNQSFSLDVMEKTNYITPEVRKSQEQVAHLLHPDQVTFFEVTEKYRKNELEEMFGEVPASARRDEGEASMEQYRMYFAGNDGPEKNPTYHLKVGASWLVSGQAKEVPYTLPLEHGNLVTPINRAQHPFVWEIGRAAQTRPGAFEETLRAETYFAYLELLHSGGKLEDATVFAHSLDPVHTRLYEKKYGMKVHSHYKDNPKERVLSVPLKTLMEKQGVDKFSTRAAQLLEAAQGALNAEETLELISQSRQRATYYLTERTPTGDQLPIQAEVRDFSKAFDKQLEQLVIHLPEPARSRVAAKLAELQPKSDLRDYMRKYMEETSRPYVGYVAGNPESLVAFLRANNSVELHSTALRGPDAVQGAEKLLAGAYHQYVEKLRVMGVLDPAQKMRDLGVQFAITSSDPWVAQELRNLGPHKRWYNQRSAITAIRSFHISTYEETLVRAMHVESVSFSVSQIEMLLESKPALNTPAAKSAFGLDREHYKRFMSEPELFTP